MIAREWKARCPQKERDAFISYLHQTGVQEASVLTGYRGAQIFSRDLEDNAEITLITFWDSYVSIIAFAGEDISKAKLYSEDNTYNLEPDNFVTHYEVAGLELAGE